MVENLTYGYSTLEIEVRAISLRRKTVTFIAIGGLVFARLLCLLATPSTHQVQVLNAGLSVSALVLLSNIWVRHRQLCSSIGSQLHDLNDTYVRLQALADVLEAQYGHSRFSEAYKDMDGDALGPSFGKPSRLN